MSGGMTISQGDPEKSTPPSYSSLFAELKAKQAESDGTVDYMKNAADVVNKKSNSVGGTVCIFMITIIFFLALPIAEIVIGALHLKQCPAQYLLPIYLIVAGAFGVSGGIGKTVDKCRQRHREPDEEESKGGNACAGIVNLFLFAWFICGTVWAFKMTECGMDNGVYQVDNTTTGCYTTTKLEDNPDIFCDGLLYKFVYYDVLVHWIVYAIAAGLGILLCSCICCICCCCASKKENEAGDAPNYESTGRNY